MKKVLSVGAASTLVLMALVAMAPAVSADKHSEQGNLSRTFVDRAGWFDFKPGQDAPGLGWFDPDDRDNNCFIRFFGTPGAWLYYETGRIVFGDAANEKLHIQVQETFLGIGCPFTTATDDADIGWTTFDVFAGVTPGVFQSHLLCLDTFSTCVPKPETAEWFLIVCKEDAADIAFDGDGRIISGEPLIADDDFPIATGSTRVTTKCGGDTDPKDPEPNLVDVTSYLVDENENQNSHSVPVGWIMNPPGKPEKKDDNSRYVVSCYMVEYSKGGEQHLAQSHDWFLVLKSGDVATALPHHLGVGTTPLQGLYDLSGDNECPQKDGNRVVLERGADPKHKDPDHTIP